MIVKRHYIWKGLCEHGIYQKYFISDCKRVRDGPAGGCSCYICPYFTSL